MINLLINKIKDNLDTLGIFDVLGGVTRVVKYNGKNLPFNCGLSLDECKSGTELVPTDNKKSIGFFEFDGIYSENDKFCTNFSEIGVIRFVFWYKCDSINVSVDGNSLDCCDKNGYLINILKEKIKKTNFSGGVFSFVKLRNFKVGKYNWSGKYSGINPRYTHPPYEFIYIDFDVEYLVDDCELGIIDLTKNIC